MDKTNNTQPPPSKYDSLQKLKDTQFKRLTGVKRATFEQMVGILAVANATKKARGGRPSKLCVEDRLLLALEYPRDYPTYLRLGQNYGVSEGYACKIQRWVEGTLVKDKRFHLPGKRKLQKSDVEYEVVLIDVAESPIERPKKRQRQYYSGKKKRHTLKAQLVVDKKDLAVICIAFANGKRHDFRLFKESKVRLHPKAA